MSLLVHKGCRHCRSHQSCRWHCLPARLPAPHAAAGTHLNLPAVSVHLTAAGTVEEQIVEFVKRQVEEEEEDPEEQPESTAMEANTSEAGRRAWAQAGGALACNPLVASGCHAHGWWSQLLTTQSVSRLPASSAARPCGCSLQ